MKLKNQIILLAAVIILIVGSINLIWAPKFIGHVVKETSLDATLNNLDKVQEEYNENSENMPPFFTKLFGNEIIELQIEREDASIETVIIKSVNGKIEKINDVDEEYTLLVELKEDTVNEILNSDDQLNAIKDALDNKEIKYSSKRIATKIKVGFARALFSIRYLFT